MWTKITVPLKGGTGGLGSSELDFFQNYRPWTSLKGLVSLWKPYKRKNYPPQTKRHLWTRDYRFGMRTVTEQRHNRTLRVWNHDYLADYDNNNGYKE